MVAAAIKMKNGPVNRQWVRLQRRALARQAPPIHSIAPVQATARASGSRAPASTMTAAGTPQYRAKDRQLPAQSRSRATAGRICTRCSGLLNRRTRHIAVGAEYAAIAAERAQHRSAMAAVIEILTGVSRHRFERLGATLRTREGRMKLGHANQAMSGASRVDGQMAERRTNTVARDRSTTVARVGAVAQVSSRAQARRLRM